MPPHERDSFRPAVRYTDRLTGVPGFVRDALAMSAVAVRRLGSDRRVLWSVPLLLGYFVVMESLTGFGLLVVHLVLGSSLVGEGVLLVLRQTFVLVYVFALPPTFGLGVEIARRRLTPDGEGETPWGWTRRIYVGTEVAAVYAAFLLLDDFVLSGTVGSASGVLTTLLAALVGDGVQGSMLYRGLLSSALQYVLPAFLVLYLPTGRLSALLPLSQYRSVLFDVGYARLAVATMCFTVVVNELASFAFVALAAQSPALLGPAGVGYSVYSGVVYILTALLTFYVLGEFADGVEPFERYLATLVEPGRQSTLGEFRAQTPTPVGGDGATVTSRYPDGTRVPTGESGAGTPALTTGSADEPGLRRTGGMGGARGGR